MEVLQIAATENSPGVTMDHTNHTIEFSKESRPENVKVFFAPVYSWLNEYENYLYFVANKQEKDIEVNCNFKMEYFNSSSAKSFLDIIEKLDSMSKKINHVRLTVNWFYQTGDEDMEETGQEIKKMTGVNLNVIAM